MLFGGCSFRLMEQIMNRFQRSWKHKGHQKGNTSLNFSPALENFRDLKDLMACSCAALVATSSLWVYLVIANNSLFTGQIVSSMVNVKQKKLNRKNLRQKVTVKSYHKNSIKNIRNFYQVSLLFNFPGVASSIKNPQVKAGRRKSYRFDPWLGKIPWMRARQHTPVFLPRVFHRQRNMSGCSPLGCTESDRTEVT